MTSLLREVVLWCYLSTKIFWKTKKRSIQTKACTELSEKDDQEPLEQTRFS